MVGMRTEPIVTATTVEVDRPTAFERFTANLGEWWPLRPLSIGGRQVVRVDVDARAGGEVAEVWGDGNRVTWGHITTWDPVDAFGMTWEVLPATTHVDVRFAELGPRLTRVTLTHSGWEALQHVDPAEITALSGGYVSGWQLVLDRFAGFAAPPAGD